MELLERDREREALETAIEESGSAGRGGAMARAAGVGQTAMVVRRRGCRRGGDVRGLTGGSYFPSIVTATTTGAVTSSPLTNSICLMTFGRPGVTVR